MKKETTATRLKTIMKERNLRQIDILNLTLPYCKQYNIKMNKSDISQYCSGKNEPNQSKLFALGAALNVNEAWLMGFDVPRERKNLNTISTNKSSPSLDILDPDEKEILLELQNTSNEQKKQLSRLIQYYNALSEIGQKKVIDNAEDMLKIYSTNPKNSFRTKSNMPNNKNSLLTNSTITDVNEAKEFLHKHNVAAFNGGKSLSDEAIIQMANIINNEHMK